MMFVNTRIHFDAKVRIMQMNRSYHFNGADTDGIMAIPDV
jgi:hypothetical protein